ncbi:MAG: hypothetical protein P4L99_21655 [Chthoniobacter sp.]|nr:hypothetical protein [Chthoniobacter sp.]
MSEISAAIQLVPQAADGVPAVGFKALAFDINGLPYAIDHAGNVRYLAVLAPAQADLTPAAVASALLFNGEIGFSLIRQKIVPTAGSGAFTAAYGLPTTNMVTGALAKVNVELPASANPTVEIHNATAGGTLLETINDATKPVPGEAAYWYGEFFFNGMLWECDFRAWQT